MGTVYIARDLKRPLRVAVKTLRPDIPLSPKRLRRFLTEALIWADLGVHPHIVQALAVSRFSASSPLIFLEFVDGQPLRSVLDGAKGHLPLLKVLDTALQCCSGMRYLHDKGIVHRDLTPNNVLVTAEGVCKLTDFGISRALTDPDLLEDDPGCEASQTVSRNAKRLTALGVALGTAPYMSPEQLSGVMVAEYPSDLFSFGVILYELLTASLPFGSGTPAEVASLQGSQPAPPSTFSFDRSYPQELDALVMACLATDPEVRPASFSVMEDRLRAIYGTVFEATDNRNRRPRTIWLKNAIRLLNQRQYREALPILGDTLEADPRDYDAWHLKGNALMDQSAEYLWNPQRAGSNPDALEMTECARSAIRCSERAIELYPRHDLAWNTKGGCLIRIGYFHRALSCLEQAIAISPSYAVAWRNRSNCLRKLGRLNEAVASYQMALALEPRNPHALNGLGVALALLKRYEDAIRCFEEAIEVAPHHGQALANHELWSAIASGRKDIAVVASMGDPAVEEHLLEVLGLNPQESGTAGNVARDQEADELGNRAWGLMNLGRLEEALDVISRAIEIDPHYSTALLHKGRILRRMKRPEEAVEVFSTALGLDPGYAVLLLNRGLALVDMQRYEEAIDDYKAYLNAEPQDSAAWLNLGYCSILISDYPEAIQNFAQSLRMEPNDCRALFGKAQAHLLMGELVEAQENCREALANDPLNADVWALHGEIAKAGSDYEQALEASRRLTDIVPEDPRGWVLGAQCLNLLQRPPELVLEWCARAQGCEHSRRLEESRAYALYRGGHFSEAHHVYDSLCTRYPGSEDLEAMRSLCLVQVETR